MQRQRLSRPKKQNAALSPGTELETITWRRQVRKMIILRGNSAGAGHIDAKTKEFVGYVAEDGVTYPAWPVGALHVAPAKDFALRARFEPIVLDIPGQPQYDRSPQANEAVARFLKKDDNVRGFYGFSGGGYNVRWILERLAAENPETLDRIDVVVVLGAPKLGPRKCHPDTINADLKKRRLPQIANWTLTYRDDPPARHQGLPKGYTGDRHMFGPECLLVETPAGRYRDVPLNVEDD